MKSFPYTIFKKILLIISIGIAFNCHQNRKLNNNLDDVSLCKMLHKFVKQDSLYLNKLKYDSLYFSFAENIIKSKSIISKDSILLRIASDYYLLGNEYFYKHLENSRKFYLVSYKLNKEFHGESIQIDMLKILTNIGLSFSNEKKFLEALKYFDSADVSDLRFQIFPSIFLQIKKGEMLINLKNYIEAEKYLKIGLNRFIEHSNNELAINSPEFKIIKNYLYELFSQISNLHIYKREFLKALETNLIGINTIRANYYNSDTSFQIANLHVNIGNLLIDSSKICNQVLIKKNLYKLALSNYEIANKYFQNIGKTELSLSCLINMSIVYFYDHQYLQQKKILQEGIAIAKQNPNQPYNLELLSLYINLGTCYCKMGLWENSMEEYYLALQIIDGNNNKNKILPSLQKFYEYYDQGSLELLISLGRVTYLLNNSEKNYLNSSICYDSLFQLVNLFKANLINDQAKINLAEQAREWIPDAFSDIKELYLITKDSLYKERAFQIVEQAKAFSLLEASRLNNASELLPKSLQNEQKEVARLQLAASSDSLKDLANGKQREFISNLKEKAPAYFALKYQGVDLKIKDIQKNLLDTNQAMIEYFIQDSLLNLFLITKNEFILDTVHITKTKLKLLIQSFQSNMNPINSDGSLSANKVQTFCDTSNYLFKILIGKIKEKHLLPERLIIVPDDMLNNLAFDALLIRISGQGNDIPMQVKDNNFLVIHHAISYCFSANLLNEMCKTKKDNKLRLSLALFAPSFHSESISLPFLNNQKAEIEEIHKIIPNSTIDLKSTKERFISGANKFAYLHISTHGYVSNDPDQSYLAFSQHTAKTDTSQLFFLKELYNYQMDQELITMTACETALGQQREGEGNISLARGFAYAGVRSFVTTLWKIPTNGATKIVPAFYNFLFNSHQTKDVALANSKRSFLKTGKNIYPENWAGLILIGNTKSVIITNSSHLLVWIVSGSLFIVFLFWIRIFRK